MPEHFNQVKVWIFTGPSQHLDSFPFQLFWKYTHQTNRLVIFNFLWAFHSLTCRVMLARPLLGRLWYSLSTHLNAPDQKIAKTSAFIEVLTLANDELIKCIWFSSTWLPLRSYGSSKGILKTILCVKSRMSQRWSEMNSEIWSLILIYLYWNDTVRRVNVQWSPNIYKGL